MTSAISRLKKKKKKPADTSDDSSRKEVRTTTTTKTDTSKKEKERVVADPPWAVRPTSLPDRTDVAKRTMTNLEDRQDDTSSSSSSSSSQTKRNVVETRPVERTQTSPAPEAKSKRDALVTDSPALRAVNAMLDDQDLTRVYKMYYDKNGHRTNLDATGEDLYSTLSEGDPTYVQTPVTDEEFAEFKGANAVVTAQSMSTDVQKTYAKALAQYKADVTAHKTARAAFDVDLAAYRAAARAFLAAGPTNEPAPVRPTAPTPPMPPTPPPKTVEEAVKSGDYFYVFNTSDLRPTVEDARARARRIVVNVTTQQAALKASAAVSRLFTDSDVSRYLSNYKVFLSQSPDGSAVKSDKLVVYYEVPSGTTDDLDPVGDRIAEAVDQSVADDEVSEAFAPFYSRIGRGIAWAEEPSAFVDDLTDSFTGTRAGIVQSVLDDNAEVKSSADFIERVRAALASRNVNPQDPHRHLPGKAPQKKYLVGRYPGTQPKPIPAQPQAPAGNAPLPRSERQAEIAARRRIPVTKIPAKVPPKVPAKPLPPVPVQRIQMT